MLVTNKYCKYYCVILSSFGETDHLTQYLDPHCSVKPVKQKSLFRKLKASITPNYLVACSLNFPSNTVSMSSSLKEQMADPLRPLELVLNTVWKVVSS